jgi:phospholipase/carboxylesterase
MLNLVHRARVPETAAGQRLPAVVLVHGWQGDEKVMGIFERTVPGGAIIVSPRAPLEVATDSFGWYRQEEGQAAFEAGVEALQSFVRQLPEAYPVDPQRVLVMGFSQGASMSYALLLKAPELMLGVAGLAGFLPDPARQWLAPGRLAGKQVFSAHGTDDETVPVPYARAARIDLERAGAEVSYHEYEGVGHKLNAQGLRDLTEWLAARLGSG